MCSHVFNCFFKTITAGILVTRGSQEREIYSGLTGVRAHTISGHWEQTSHAYRLGSSLLIGFCVPHSVVLARTPQTGNRCSVAVGSFKFRREQNRHTGDCVPHSSGLSGQIFLFLESWAPPAHLPSCLEYLEYAVPWAVSITCFTAITKATS